MNYAELYARHSLFKEYVHYNDKVPSDVMSIFKGSDDLDFLTDFPFLRRYTVKSEYRDVFQPDQVVQFRLLVMTNCDYCSTLSGGIKAACEPRTLAGSTHKRLRPVGRRRLCVVAARARGAQAALKPRGSVLQ